MRRILPKNLGDWIAFVFTFVMMHVMAIFELFVILPYIDERGSEAYWIHLIVGLFLYINTMASLWYTMTVDTTSAGVVLPSILKAGWRFCSFCECNAPPRSFHCWVCKKCILVRDHHCVFTGNCVGHSNRRYYMQMIFYIWMAAAYCNFLHVDYVLEMLHEGFTWQALVTMMMPMVAWATGISHGYKFNVSFISSSSILCFLLVGALFIYHLMNVVAGQTSNEKAKKCHDYDFGWQNNMAATYGRNWTYAWISPFIPSPLPTDGINQKKREEIKDI